MVHMMHGLCVGGRILPVNVLCPQSLLACDPPASNLKACVKAQVPKCALLLHPAAPTVTDDGFLSSQRPSKTGMGSSSQPSDTNPAAAAAPAASVAPAALQALHQLLALQPAAPAAAAAARLTALVACLSPDASIPAELLPALGVCATEGTAPTGSTRADEAGPSAAGAGAAVVAVEAKDRLGMLLLLLQALNSGPQQCPELVACMSRQLVACLNQAAGDAELLPVLLQALLLALVATVGSIAVDPGSTDVHVRVWQHAQDLLQVSRGKAPGL